MANVKVAINGFGRIGRMTTRVLMQQEDITLVGINDQANKGTLAHLFQYDTVHGRYPDPVEVSEEGVKIGDQEIPFFSEKDPEKLPWKTLEVDVVIEATGVFRSREKAEKHLEAGAAKVIISAPPEGDDIKTIVPGINEHILDGSETIVSNASCTTNSAAPLVEIIDQLCGIESGYITTVHSYTGDQRLHDAPHKDLRRARAAASSIVPTTTGAAKAITRVFAHLEGKMGGCGIRVPVPDGSLTDITYIVREPKTVEEVNQAFRKKAEGNLQGILQYIEDPVVSVDILGNSHSCVFDAQLTSVIGSMIKVVGWYDNEVGYSNRLVDLIRKLFPEQ